MSVVIQSTTGAQGSKETYDAQFETGPGADGTKAELAKACQTSASTVTTEP